MPGGEFFSLCRDRMPEALYLELLRCLNLYSQQILDRSEVQLLVQALFESSSQMDLFSRFRGLLGYTSAVSAEGEATPATPGTQENQPVDDASNLTVDFTKLDMATLKRYKRHYRLKTRQNVTKTELALAVAKHFASQTVDEADTISLFMYSARAGSLDLAAAARTRGAFE